MFAYWRILSGRASHKLCWSIFISNYHIYIFRAYFVHISCILRVIETGVCLYQSRGFQMAAVCKSCVYGILNRRCFMCGCVVVGWWVCVYQRGEFVSFVYVSDWCGVLAMLAVHIYWFWCTNRQLTHNVRCITHTYMIHMHGEFTYARGKRQLTHNVRCTHTNYDIHARGIYTRNG